jgi:hypothetical protein
VKTGRSKVGIAVALVIGLVVGYLVGAGKSRSGGIVGALGGGRMSREAWIAKAKENKFFIEGTRYVGYDVDKDTFCRVMGHPDKTQASRDRVTWYYKCSDGMIGMTMGRVMLEKNGKIATTEEISEY